MRLGLALGLFKMAIFGVGSSLKWMPQHSELKSGACIRNSKAAVSAYTTLGQVTESSLK